MNPDRPEGIPIRGSAAILRVVVYYAVFSALWILLSDRLVLIVARSPAQITTLSTLKGWLFVGVTSLLLYRGMKRVLLGPAGAWERRARIRRLVPPSVVLGLVILALAWGGIAQVYRQLERTEDARLQAIADSKARQVSAWVRERRGDATYAASSPFWTRAYFAWKRTGDPAERDRLFGGLETYRKLKGFRGVQVVDVQPDSPLSAPPILAEAAKVALAEGEQLLVGPYRDGKDLRLDILAPMAPVDGRAGPLLVLTIDPAEVFYPMLQAWPVPTSSGEVVLFRRMGGLVAYLSGPPQESSLQVGTTRPIERSELVSSGTPLGTFTKGMDYRGAPVVGVVQAVPGTDWYLVAKIDQAELYAEGRSQVAVIGLAALLALFLAILVERTFRQQRVLAQGERDRDSWLRFRQVFEAAPVPMCILGVEGRMTAVNGQFTRTLGYALDEVADLQAWLERACPGPGEARSWWAACPAGGAPFETSLTCRDGEIRTVLASATAIGGEHLVTLADITDRVLAERERQALQAEILQAQKMDSIGRLAGGVAHDFNNMLGVIVANAEVGILASAPGSVQERFEEIKKAAMRSADLTRKLLAFARKQAVSPKAINLNDALPGMLQMLARLIGENITLDYAQREGLWAVRMDPTQVDQILANLAVNARDAISGVGRMGIHTENRTLGAAEAQGMLNARAGDYVVLEVTDTGSGMDAEVLSHIFEPFYTTKGVGRGTGLGLATVYGIVNQNGGFIEVVSAPGRGSSFRVHLPRHDGPAEPGSDTAPAPPSLGGRECVLVVEDEVMHLDVTVMLLRSLGYETLAAASPSEALAFLEQPALKVDLLLTDVIMPEMNGRDLAERARALRPGLPCLLMSGYTADVMARSGVPETEVDLLGKPFTLEALAAHVRGVLDRM